MAHDDQVGVHLKRHTRFGTGEWKAAHIDKKVNEIVILYSDATDISERATVERSNYDPLELAKSTFSYLPLAQGSHARRQLSCWCVPCFGVRGRGLGTADSNLVIAGCSCAGNSQRRWHEQECRCTDSVET